MIFIKTIYHLFDIINIIHILEYEKSNHISKIIIHLKLLYLLLSDVKHRLTT